MPKTRKSVLEYEDVKAYTERCLQILYSRIQETYSVDNQPIEMRRAKIELETVILELWSDSCCLKDVFRFVLQKLMEGYDLDSESLVSSRDFK